VILAALALAIAAQPYDRFLLSNSRFNAMLSPVYERCERAPTTRNTYEIRRCIWDEQRRFQTRVAGSYRAASARLPAGGGRMRLATLQQRWQATHRIACRRRFQGVDGTMSLISEDMCALRELVRRVAWLERYGR